MQTTSLPWWQQVTALVSLSASGAVTGFTIAPNAAAGAPAETSTQIQLLATTQKAAQTAAKQTATEEPATDQTGPPTAGHDTAHGAAAALRSPEPARPAVPARGAIDSAGGSGGSQAAPGPADSGLAQDDSSLRPAIVNVANYYLRMAANKTPAEMEAIIWQHDSLDGVDHGPSCAAFASLTLELGAQAVGQQSWVSGGGSYPWPLHDWAVVRVDPNPASPGIVSVKQEAQQHGRWHPLGDGYQPQPGDWVLFDGHVEVVTQDSTGVLHTIGGDSLPNFSVNAHEYSGSLAAYGIEGFVNNGELAGAAGAGGQTHAQPTQTETAQAETAQPETAQTADQPSASPSAGGAAVPGSTGSGTAAADSGSTGQPLSARGLTTPASHAPAGYHIHHVRSHGHVRPHGRPRSGTGNQAGIRKLSQSSVPGADAGPSVTLDASTHGTAAVPGLSISTHYLDAPPTALTTPYSRHLPAAPAGSAPDTAAQRGFIATVVPGAIATQHQYGIPAAVTIAQAIDESGWGQSGLAVQDHNLFGIKGSGPAGRDWQETEEFENGQYVTRNASFRVYNDVAESIHDHGKLLATSGYYHQAMAEQHNPDAFASALTGVYATDPSYGAKLIALMRHYNLYRYDVASPPQTADVTPVPGGAAIPGIGGNGTATGPAAGAITTTTTRRTPSPSRGSTPPTPPPTHVPSPPSHWTDPPTPTPVPSPPSHWTTPPTPTHVPSPPSGSAAPPTPTHLPSPPNGSATSPTPTHVPSSGRGSSTPPTPARASRPPRGPAMPPTPIPVPEPSSPTPEPGPGTQMSTGTPPRTRAATEPQTASARSTGSGSPTAPAPGTRTVTRKAPPAGTASGSRAASGAGVRTSPRTAGPGTATRQRPPSSVADIPGTATAPASAATPGLALGGEHQPTSPSAAASSDHTTASTQSASTTRLTGQGSTTAKLTAQGGRATGKSHHDAPDQTSQAVTTAELTAQGTRTTGDSHHRGPADQTVITAELTAHTAPATELSHQDAPGGLIDQVATAARLTDQAVSAAGLTAQSGRVAPGSSPNAKDAAARVKRTPLSRYQHAMPNAVRTAFVTAARGPLLRAEPLYRDVASHTGVHWQLLAACDWMQCEARPSHSPVHGEKLGTVNPDGTSYRTKSAALEQCADDLVELAGAVYGIDLLARRFLSVRDLANVFAAFRWGGLLMQHRTSAMEFPYSVAGLTPDRMSMRWPNIAEPHAPDKPGARFRRPFGAVPVVLNLNYPVTI